MKVVLDLTKLNLYMLLLLHKDNLITEDQLKEELSRRNLSDLDILRIVRGNK